MDRSGSWQEMQPGISSLFLSSLYFFPLGTSSWGWIFEVCSHQAIPYALPHGWPQELPSAGSL